MQTLVPNDARPENRLNHLEDPARPAAEAVESRTPSDDRSPVAPSIRRSNS